MPNNILHPSMQYFSTKLKVRFSGSCLIESAIRYKHGISVNNYIVYEINKTIKTTGSDLTLENCLFGEVTLAKNADINKYKYSCYGTGFDRRGNVSFPCGGFGQNVLIFGVDISFFAHIDT